MSSGTEASPARHWLRFAIASTIVAAMSYPTIWMFFSAFKSNREFFKYPLSLPTEWHFSNFTEAWRVGKMDTLYLNSFLVTLCSVSISVLCATAAAFAFSRR